MESPVTVEAIWEPAPYNMYITRGVNAICIPLVEKSSTSEYTAKDIALEVDDYFRFQLKSED